MSLQVFLQAQLLGIEEFLTAYSDAEDLSELTGRCAWISLYCEVLPRALLAELKLSRMLLGSSSAEQFLLVLPDSVIEQANQFLKDADHSVRNLSSGTLKLVWSSTENLGSWPIARKRLDDALQSAVAAPLASESSPETIFQPFEAAVETASFSKFADLVSTAERVGWSYESDLQLEWNSGKFTWPLKDQSGIDDEAIVFPRRFAANDAGTLPATLGEVSQRAEGTASWGILRGDVDAFDARLRRANTIEEHIHLSVLFKEFFAGELSILCTLPDFWRTVTILYRGGNSFAVVGAWDALLMMARELQRLFEKFAEQHLEALAGVEGKTLTVALAIAPEVNALPSAVFESAGTQLRSAKAAEPGSFHLFGRTLEWKRLADAEELKAGLVRLVRDAGFSSEVIRDLVAVYREASSIRISRRVKAQRVEKPWRTYVRVMRVIPSARGKESTNLRNAVIANLVGKRTAGVKLRPSARVGLEWARLAAGE